MNQALRTLQVGHFPAEPGKEATRVVNVGGGLTVNTAHPDVLPFEQMFRVIPPAGVYAFDVSDSRTIAFDVGQFKAPANQVLLVYNLRPQIYYYSGIAPDDVVPAGDRALSTKLGYNLTVTGSNIGLMSYDLRPTPAKSAGVQAFAGVSDLFVSSRSSFGRGSNLQPSRSERFGAPQLPFTVTVQANATLACQGVVFGRFTQPVAYIEYAFQGIQVSQDFHDHLLSLVKLEVRGYR